MITFNHFNFNVLDLDKSLAFYRDALDLKVVRENHKEAFSLVFLGDGVTGFSLELTYLKMCIRDSHRRDHPCPMKSCRSPAESRIFGRPPALPLSLIHI